MLMTMGWVALAVAVQPLFGLIWLACVVETDCHMVHLLYAQLECR